MFLYYYFPLGRGKIVSASHPSCIWVNIKSNNELNANFSFSRSSFFKIYASQERKFNMHGNFTAPRASKILYQSITKFFSDSRPRKLISFHFQGFLLFQKEILFLWFIYAPGIHQTCLVLLQVSAFLLQKSDHSGSFMLL